MWRVALQMLTGDRGKYLSLVCGLAFAVLLITQQGSIFLGLILRATGPLQNVTSADLWVADEDVRYISDTRFLGDEDLQRVRSIEGVLWAEPFFTVRTTATLPDGTFYAVNLIGIDRTTMVGRPPEVTLGNLQDLRIPDAVFVEESARAKLANPNIGDVLKLNDKRAVVVGYCRAKSGFDSPAVVYTSYENAVRYVPLPRNNLSYILVGIKPDADLLTVQKAVSTLPDIAAFTRDEMRAKTARFILAETGIGINFGITVLLGFVVGLVVSGAIFYQFTIENLRNFAVLKAMGATPFRLMGMVLLQALTVGLIGYGVGVGAAGLFGFLASKPGAELAFHFPWQLMVLALVGMLLCVCLGSLLSLNRVLRLEAAVVFK